MVPHRQTGLYSVQGGEEEEEERRRGGGGGEEEEREEGREEEERRGKRGVEKTEEVNTKTFVN